MKLIIAISTLNSCECSKCEGGSEVSSKLRSDLVYGSYRGTGEFGNIYDN